MIKKLQKHVKKYASTHHVRTVSLVALLVIVLTIPLTVYTVQQQQDVRQQAAESTPFYGGTQTVACGEIVQDIPEGSKEGILTYRTPASVNNQWETRKIDGTILNQEAIRNKMRNSHFYQDIGSGDMEHEITRLVPNPDPTSSDYHPETITCRLWFDYDTADCKVSFVDPSQAGKSNENWLYVGDQPKDIQLKIEENPNGTSFGQCDLEIHMHTPVTGTTPTPTQPEGGSPTNVPSPTAVGPTATGVPSMTPGVTTVTGTNTPTPSLVPSLTPTMSSEPTRFSFSVALPGIGTRGNTTPNNMERTAIVQLFDKNNKKIGTDMKGSLSFDSGSGMFIGDTNFGTIVPTDTYTIKLKVDQFLTKIVASKTPITAGVTNILPSVTLISGDINNDNKLDMLDYNILVSCYGAKINSDGCGGKKVDADLSDDAQVDGIDYNLLLSGLKTAKKGE